MSEPRIGDVWPVLRRWRRLEALARTHCVLASILATLGAFPTNRNKSMTVPSLEEPHLEQKPDSHKKLNFMEFRDGISFFHLKNAILLSQSVIIL